jgi:serine protease Do
MDITQYKNQVPLFVAGFLGALVCLILVGVLSAAVVLASPLREELQLRFSAVIDQIVTEKNLTDSAGNHSDVIDVVDAVNPAVVSIVITKDVPKLERIIDEGAQSPFGFFSFPQYRQNGTEEKEIGGGSGFLVSDDGYIVTNAHVVSDDGANYTVYFNDESQYDGEVVSSDATLDIAVLKIDITDAPYLEFGDSDTVQVGQTVIAIGNALGEFRNTVSVGVISGLSRSITAGSGGSSEFLADVLQTDAAINPGNSGGPLLDLAGKVIGVNVATSSGGENISFSLPSNAVKAAVESIKTTGHVVQAYLGVRFVMVTDVMAEENALPVTDGALIRRGDDVTQLAVIPGSPADKAGLEENDIITRIVRSMWCFVRKRSVRKSR